MKQHNSDKYPVMFAEMEEMQTRESELMVKRKVFTDQINDLGKQIGVLKVEKEQLNDSANVDISELRTLRREIAKRARFMGASGV